MLPIFSVEVFSILTSDHLQLVAISYRPSAGKATHAMF